MEPDPGDRRDLEHGNPVCGHALADDLGGKESPPETKGDNAIAPSITLKTLWSSTVGRRTVLILGALVISNSTLWSICLGIARAFPAILAGALLAWTLGLRHAIDADHIAAIDGIVRWLVQLGQQPMLVGLFFSLGHSIVVFCATTALVLLLWKLQDSVNGFENVERILGIVGSAVSSLFLFSIAMANAWILFSAWRSRKRKKEIDMEVATSTVELETESCAVEKTEDVERMEVGTTDCSRASGNEEKDPNLPLDPQEIETSKHMHSGGPCARLAIAPLTKLIDRSWKALPLGLLFGLGFDTAIQVVLLATSAADALPRGRPWALLMLPLLFAGGMALADTLDGIFAFYAYRYAIQSPDRRRAYNLAVTGFSLAVTLVIGAIQTVNLVDGIVDAPNGTSTFWDGVRGMNSEVIGAAVVGGMLLVFVGGVVWYSCCSPRM